MSFTRPKGEQLEFRSARTGFHVLDTYLEASEKGNRTLPDLLSDLFGDDGNVNKDLFQFRIDPETFAFQVRRGVFLDPDDNWVDVPDGFFFRPRRDWQPNTFYEIHDLFLYQQSLFLVTRAHTSVEGGPGSDDVMVLISGIAGRIPVEDADLEGNGTYFLRVREGEDGYELVESTAKPTFFGFNVSQDGSQLLMTSGRNDDFKARDFTTWAALDVGYRFAIKNNELVIEL